MSDDVEKIINDLPITALTPAAAEALGRNEVNGQPPTGTEVVGQSTTGTKVDGQSTTGTKVDVPQNQNEERIIEPPVEKTVDDTQQGGRRTFKRKGGKRKQHRRKTHKKKRRSNKRR